MEDKYYLQIVRKGLYELHYSGEVKHNFVTYKNGLWNIHKYVFIDNDLFAFNINNIDDRIKHCETQYDNSIFAEKTLSIELYKKSIEQLQDIKADLEYLHNSFSWK